VAVESDVAGGLAASGGRGDLRASVDVGEQIDAGDDVEGDAGGGAGDG
jgi:hypothetical protein